MISDPGYKLVRAAHEAGHAVTSLPGASALLAALTNAGLPTDRFFFEGFLPAKASQRAARIGELARIPATLVLFESGPRLADALSALATGLGDREAAVCRELTKLHEEVRRDTLPRLAAGLRARTRDARRDRHRHRAAGRERCAARCGRARRHHPQLIEAIVAQGRGQRDRAVHRRAAPRGLSARADRSPKRNDVPRKARTRRRAIRNRSGRRHSCLDCRPRRAPRRFFWPRATGSPRGAGAAPPARSTSWRGAAIS